MSFTTLTFVVFLGSMFGLYWSVRRRAVQNAVLILGSYFFYAWWDYRFCSLMLISTLVDFGVGWGLARTSSRGRRRGLLVLSVVCNLGLLGFFKYFNFFAENLFELANSVGWHLDQVTMRIILPVGISFYTFQTMSYTIDVYRGKLRATSNLLDYFAYVSFFPQLVAGPIERASRLLPQFASPRRFDYETTADGCRQILWGFFKKMILVDNVLAPIVDACYRDPSNMSGPQMAFATFCFAFQIYADFSAYSDIAIGTARLFGIDLMRNFAYPYFSQNVAEFWRRWHISLSTWFRDYVYIPLGGSRVAPWRKSGNVIITFLLSGLWHGASWKFVIWGGLNGVGILPTMFWRSKDVLRATDTPGGERHIPRPTTAIKMCLTIGFICLTWVFFRAADIGQAMMILKKIAFDAFSFPAYERLYLTVGVHSVLVLVGFVLVEWIQRRRHHVLRLESLSRWLRWTLYTCLVWVVLIFGTGRAGPFIYFQF